MVSREIESYRQVTNVVPDTTAGSLIGAVGKIGSAIIEANQEAKITENFSRAQLELNKLNMSYQQEYENNPLAGMDKLKESRKALFDTLGGEISPFFRGKWDVATRELGMKNDATVEAWAYKQARQNTVKSINQSIKNNIGQAYLNGQSYGNGGTTELDAMLDFGLTKRKLAQFGDKHIGAEETTNILENYDEDNLKSFLSGVSETNPLQALRLMDDPLVAKSFRNPQQYMKMKEAIGNRAMNVQKIMGEKQVLNALKDQNNLLTKSLESPVSYLELQTEFDKQKMSPEAQSFFLKANGYSAREGGKMSQSQQLVAKADLYSEITGLAGKPDMTSDDIAVMQNKVYTAMDRGVLTEKEGMTWINQVTTPYVERKESSLTNYGENNWLQDDIGFQGVQEIFDKQIAIQPSEGEADVGELSQMTNNQKKVKLYDYYMQNLEQSAASYGVKIGDVPNLGAPQKRKLYSEAQAAAVKQLMIEDNPALSTLNDIPNQVFQNGKLIQGASGNRDLKPDFSAKGDFVILEKNGHRARRYKDGTIEVLN